MTYSDAGGLGKGREEKSQGGHLFCLTDEQGENVASFIHWESRVIQRKTVIVCRGNAFGGGGIQHSNVAFGVVGRADAGLLEAENFMLVENRGLQTNVVNTKLPAQKRLRGDLAGLRKGLRQGEYQMRWIPDGSMLADPMTKGDIFTSPTE
jgi:hypothetical protein